VYILSLGFGTAKDGLIMKMPDSRQPMNNVAPFCVKLTTGEIVSAMGEDGICYVAGVTFPDGSTQMSAPAVTTASTDCGTF